MGITYTTLTADTDQWDPSPYVTASITPGANKLILLTVWSFAQIASTPFYSPSSVTGNGLTWTLVGSQDYFPDEAGAPTVNLHSRVSVYRAVGASPTTGPITVTYSGTQPDGIAWAVRQYDGVDVTGTNGANAIVQWVGKQSAPTHPAPNLSITLAALGSAANATYGAFGGPWDAANGDPITLGVGSGYTQLSSGGANWLWWMDEIKLAGSTTVDATSTLDAESLGGIAIEIKAAASPTDITATPITADTDWRDGNTYITAPVTPTANKLQLLAIAFTCVEGQVADTLGVTGCGLTWTEVARVNLWNNQGNVVVFRAVGAAPTTGTITIASAPTITTCNWSLVEFDHVDVSSGGTNAIAQIATNSATFATSLTVPLGAFSNVKNIAYGAFGAASQGGVPGTIPIIPGSGATLLHTVGEEWSNVGTEWYPSNKINVRATVAAATDFLAGIALELRTSGTDSTVALGGNTITVQAGNLIGNGTGPKSVVITGNALTSAVGNMSKGFATEIVYRNPYKQPFAVDSIWNTAIGSGAKMSPANLTVPVDPQDSVSTIWACFPFSDREILIFTPTEANCKINYSDVGWGGGNRCTTTGGLLTTVPIAPSYTVGNNPENGSAAILSKDFRSLENVQPFTRCTAGGDATSYVRFATSDIYGDGIAGAHGGSGMSALGGSIRLGELRPGQLGMQHALKITLYAAQFLYKAQTWAAAYRWPALGADGYAVGKYGTNSNATNANNPNMVMGSLLAIAPTVNINNLGLETGPALQLAWTLQNYGAYIVDDAWGPNFLWNTEEGYAGSKIAEFQSDWGFPFQQRMNDNSAWTRDHKRLCEALSVVTNNGPSTIGGGGVPRQPLAAPFSATWQSEQHAFSNSASSLLINVPADVVVNDLLIASIAAGGDVTIIAPSDWILIRNVKTGATSADTQQSTYWMPATMWLSAYTWTFSGATACNGTIWRIKDAAFGTPINAVSTNSGTGKTLVGLQVTPSVNNTLLCHVTANRTAGTTWSMPPFWAARNAAGPSSTMQLSGTTASFYDTLPTGDLSITTNGTTGDKWTSQVIAIAPNTVSVVNPDPGVVAGGAVTGSSEWDDNTIFVTDPATPTANCLQLLAVAFVQVTPGTLATPTVTGCGLTWTPVKFVDHYPSYGRLVVYRAMGAAPTTDVLTITHPVTMTTCAWSLTEYANVDTSGSNGANAIVQSASATITGSTNLGITLGAFASNSNATYGAFAASGSLGEAGGIAFTAGSGFTQLHSIGQEWVNLETEWRTDKAINITSATDIVTDFLGGIAIEIKAGSTGTAKTLTGNEAALQIGNVVIQNSKGITGNSVTSAVGSVGVQKDVVVALTGNGITAGAGALGAPSHTDLAGVEIACSAGTMTASSSIDIALTGNDITSAAGSVGTDRNVIVALTGNAINAVAGSVATSRTAAVSGNQASVLRGDMTAQNSITLAITGNQIDLQAGNVRRYAVANRPYVFVST